MELLTLSVPGQQVSNIFSLCSLWQHLNLEAVSPPPILYSWNKSNWIYDFVFVHFFYLDLAWPPARALSVFPVAFWSGLAPWSCLPRDFISFPSPSALNEPSILFVRVAEAPKAATWDTWQVAVASCQKADRWESCLTLASAHYAGLFVRIIAVEALLI